MSSSRRHRFGRPSAVAYRPVAWPTEPVVLAAFGSAGLRLQGAAAPTDRRATPYGSAGRELSSIVFVRGRPAPRLVSKFRQHALTRRHNPPVFSIFRAIVPATHSCRLRAGQEIVSRCPSMTINDRNRPVDEGAYLCRMSLSIDTRTRYAAARRANLERSATRACGKRPAEQTSGWAENGLATT